MRAFFAAITLVGFVACAPSEPDTQSSQAQTIPITPSGDAPVIPAKASAQAPEKEAVKEAPIPEATNVEPLVLSCAGVIEQGGLVRCQTQPYQSVRVSRGGDDFFNAKADANGVIFIGFDRDEKHAEISIPGKPESNIIYDLPARDYKVSRIDGLPPSQVSTFTEEQLAHIRAASKRKKVGFASRQEAIGFSDGFIYPLKEFVKTTPFGAQRILNGEPKNPHYGVDIAAPKGTPIVAPADGVVSLADDDMYFEGQMVMIDHGQGLNSIYLHMSEIDVQAGQSVKQGEQIGRVGSTGRSTGPHLCWRLKWRNRNLDPELLTQWPQQN